MATCFFSEAVSIMSDRVVIRKVWEGPRGPKKPRHLNSLLNLKSRSDVSMSVDADGSLSAITCGADDSPLSPALGYPGQKGIVTKGVARRMRKILEGWTAAMKVGACTGLGRQYMLAFVTLTLPSPQIKDENGGFDDKKANVSLNRFLEKMQKAGYCRYYFWRAEPQANGNIHYHVITDRYCPHDKLRKIWLSCLDASYIEAYRAEREAWHAGGFRFDGEALARSQKKNPKKPHKWATQEKQYEAYLEGVASNWEYPNCTDIHKLRSVDSVARYVTKYCTKNEPDRRPLNSRVWGCSDALKTVCEVQLSSVEMRISDFVGDCYDDAKSFEAKNPGKIKVREDEFFTVIYTRNVYEIMRLHERLQRRVFQHYRNIFYELYSDIFRAGVGGSLVVLPAAENARSRRDRTPLQMSLDFKF